MKELIEYNLERWNTSNIDTKITNRGQVWDEAFIALPANFDFASLTDSELESLYFGTSGLQLYCDFLNGNLTKMQGVKHFKCGYNPASESLFQHISPHGLDNLLSNTIRRDNFWELLSNTIDIWYYENHFVAELRASSWTNKNIHPKDSWEMSVWKHEHGDWLKHFYPEYFNTSDEGLSDEEYNKIKQDILDSCLTEDQQKELELEDSLATSDWVLEEVFSDQLNLLNDINLMFILFFCTVLFSISLYGLLFNCKNLLFFIIYLELMILSVGFHFVTFSYYFHEPHGQICALLLIGISACEAALGLSLIVVASKINGCADLREE